MQVRLTKPELERFVDEKVRSGHFPTPEAVVEDALARMMEEEVVLTSEDLAAIDESDKEIERGEGVDFEKFAKDTRARFGIK